MAGRPLQVGGGGGFPVENEGKGKGGGEGGGWGGDRQNNRQVNAQALWKPPFGKLPFRLSPRLELLAPVRLPSLCVDARRGFELVLAILSLNWW